MYIKQVCETPQGPKCSQFHLDAFLENVAKLCIGALPHISSALSKAQNVSCGEDFGYASVNGN